MKAKQYMIVSESSYYELSDTVNDNLRLGWDLYGSPFIVTVGIFTNYCQAMILPIDTTTP